MISPCLLAVFYKHVSKPTEMAKAFEENECPNPMGCCFWKWKFNKDLPALVVRALVCFSGNRSVDVMGEISCVSYGCWVTDGESIEKAVHWKCSGKENHSGMWFLWAGRRPTVCHRLIKYIEDEVSKSSVGSHLKQGMNSDCITYSQRPYNNTALRQEWDKVTRGLPLYGEKAWRSCSTACLRSALRGRCARWAPPWTSREAFAQGTSWVLGNLVSEMAKLMTPSIYQHVFAPGHL